MKNRLGLIILGCSSLLLASCAEDTASVNVILTIPDATTLALIQQRPSTARVWYTYEGKVDSTGKNANTVQPAGSVPLVVGTAPNQANDWSTALGAGVSFTVGQGNTIQLIGLPLGKRATQFAIEILQSFTSDNSKIHPVAFALFSEGTDPLSSDQLKANLSVTQPLVVGRTCGEADKAVKFTAPYTDAQFLAACK
ncbi:MAG: hypothetical protein JWQ35_2204 [Bacteriovoracaceae bacterium]|nr:hypothetical protein [Bacteriovoracaceae bacterium]